MLLAWESSRCSGRRPLALDAAKALGSSQARWPRSATKKLWGMLAAAMRLQALHSVLLSFCGMLCKLTVPAARLQATAARRCRLQQQPLQASGTLHTHSTQAHSGRSSARTVQKSSPAEAGAASYVYMCTQHKSTKVDRVACPGNGPCSLGASGLQDQAPHVVTEA